MSEFVSAFYTTNLNKAINHVKYIGFRKRSSEKGYGLFNDRFNNVEANDFVLSIKEKKNTHPTAAKIHTLLFSMSGDEWERGNYQADDYQKLIRNVMLDWQLKRNINVEWVAAIHDEKNHPHVHVTIKSLYKDSDGVKHKLKIDGEDKKTFKELFKEEKERIVSERFGFEPMTKKMQLEQKQERKEKPQMALNSLKEILNQIDKMREKELAREREWGRER